MKAGALRQLTVAHLRGSVIPFALPFEKGKKLTVIYGENGTGKSTICDAFEFIGKGKVGSLENRGLGKTNRYWPSLGKKLADVSVSLELENETCRATIGKNDVVAIPQECRPRVEVLRRKQILALIEAQPGDRYSAISRFIDVSGVEASEGSLRQLIHDLTESQKDAVTRIHENEVAIRGFWNTAGNSSKDPFSWAKDEATRDEGTFDVETNALGELQISYSRLTDYPEKFMSVQKELKEAHVAVAAAKKHEEECLKSISQDAGEVIEILEAAKAYVSKHPSPSVCPLCESAEKAEGLASRINQRLNSFAELKSARESTNAAKQSLQLIEQNLKSIHDSLKRNVDDFEKCKTKYSWPTGITIPTSPPPVELAKLSNWLGATAHLPIEWKKVETSWQDKKLFVSALKKAFQTWRDNMRDQKELERLIPRLQQTLEIIEEERRLFTSAILAAIANEVGRLYEIVHPGEGLNKISLELDPHRRASLDIGANICGQSMPPQAYFSDSHLDTLGLCVFLALSAMDQPENTILILDDVLMSTDEPHVERLIEMLYSEANKFRHCIITTHYRPWKYKLRWGWLQNGECQFIELAKWTASNGMTLIRSIPDIERLRHLLAESPPDIQLVCSKAGVILEAALDFLTLLYECAVPRRQSGLYTLGDLLPSIDKKLRQALRVEVLTGRDAGGVPIFETVSLTAIFNELIRIAQARNVFGCHFNELSFDLLDADALGFARQVLDLMDVLIDDKAGWPKNGKSGSYWSTKGETRKLHPYKKPM